MLVDGVSACRCGRMLLILDVEQGSGRMLADVEQDRGKCL